MGLAEQNPSSRCFYCGEPVDIHAPWVWRRVTGWERKATAASRKRGSDIALREPLLEFAHDHCIRRARQGIPPLQESLL